MTETELRAFLEESGKQPAGFVEETLLKLSAPETKRLFATVGEKITDEEAQDRAKIRRRDFVESIRVIEAGGALGFDGWRPK